MPFRDIIGHRRLVQLLSRSAARGSLPPSLIFAGPAGVGKRLTATALAQALNCLKPIDALPSRKHTTAGDRQADPARQAIGHEIDACGVCAACRRIARHVHPDVIVVEPGDNGSIKIDQVRDVVDRVGYRPFEGRRRVVIIDQADALVTAAQNALLKTLEEPPSSSVLVLVTSLPDVLLATVRSRCPQLRFRGLSAQEIADALVARGRSETEARAVAATADGSLGRALEASADDLVEAREIAHRVLLQAGSTPEARRRIESAKELLTIRGGGTPDRDQLALHLRAMSSLLRDAELLSLWAPLSTSGDVQGLANPDIRPQLEVLTRTYRGDRGVRAFAAVDRALVALGRNAGVKIVADWVALQL
jgi:DNA polymerase-3 subunit delta'